VRPTMMPRPRPKPAWEIAVGLVLVVPALALLIVSYVEPVLWTVRSSRHQVSVRRLDGGGGAPGHDFGFAIGLMVVPVLLVLVAAPLLAGAAHRGGTVSRWFTRALLAVPLAAYAPSALVVSRFVKDRRIDGSTYLWGTFGLVMALGVTLFLAALRRRDPGRRPWGAVLVAGAVGVAGVIAAALQEFTTFYLAPRNQITPLVEVFRTSFVQFDFARASSTTVKVLVPLIVLGLALTVLLILSGARLEFDKPWRSADERTRPARPVGWAVAGAGAVLVLMVTLVGIGPELSHLFGGSRGGFPIGPVLAHTWLPPLISSLVGVVVAGLAGFGIGWLRPLGRHSEWLLVPFGLFLFVGIGPLAVRAYASGSVNGRLESFASLIPPVWVALPALFVLTLMFRGQAARAEALRQELRPVPPIRLLLPVLPMAGVVFGATWVVRAQDLIWPLISASRPQHWAAPVALMSRAGEALETRDLPFSLVLPGALFLALLLITVAVQVVYLDRVALRTGLPEHETPPRT
jgi:hypothetical protein